MKTLRTLLLAAGIPGAMGAVQAEGAEQAVCAIRGVRFRGKTGADPDLEQCRKPDKGGGP
jgi:hypothetical protein